MHRSPGQASTGKSWKAFSPSVHLPEPLCTSSGLPAAYQQLQADIIGQCCADQAAFSRSLQSSLYCPLRTSRYAWRERESRIDLSGRSVRVQHMVGCIDCYSICEMLYRRLKVSSSKRSISFCLRAHLTVSSSAIYRPCTLIKTHESGVLSQGAYSMILPYVRQPCWISGTQAKP